MNKSTRFWDRVADSSGDQLGATSQKTIALSLPYLKAKDLILDFGCGPGNLSNAIAQHAKQVDGIDTSNNMISIAQATAAKHQVSNVHYACIDLFDPKLKTNYYDTVLAFNVLPYISDVTQVAERMAALLKPGGLFISATACLGDGLHPLRPLMFILSKLGMVPKMQFYKRAKLQTLIEAAGFQLIAHEKISALPEYLLVMKCIEPSPIELNGR